MSDKNMITFTCENRRCGKVLYAEPSQAHHVIKCSHCGTKVLVPDPLGPKLDDKYLWELPFRERLKTRAQKFIERCQRLVERIPTGGIVLIWTGVFMGAWLIVAAPNVPLNFGAILNEIASVGEIHRVPYSNHDGSRILYARTTEKGVGVYLYAVGGVGYGVSEMGDGGSSEGGVRSGEGGSEKLEVKGEKTGSTGGSPVSAGGAPGEGKGEGKKLEVRGEGQRLGVASPHQSGEESRGVATASGPEGSAGFQPALGVHSEERVLDNSITSVGGSPIRAGGTPAPRGKPRLLLELDEGDLNAMGDHFDLFGWSPGDAYFAFGQKSGIGWAQEITICDGINGAFRAAVTLRESAAEFVWLSSGSFAVLDEGRVLHTWVGPWGSEKWEVRGEKSGSTGGTPAAEPVRGAGILPASGVRSQERFAVDSIASIARPPFHAGGTPALPGSTGQRPVSAGGAPGEGKADVQVRNTEVGVRSGDNVEISVARRSYGAEAANQLSVNSNQRSKSVGSAGASPHRRTEKWREAYTVSLAPTTKKSGEARRVPRRQQRAAVKMGLVALGPNHVGFGMDGQLWSVDVRTGAKARLSNFTKPMLFEWLTWHPERKEFLFCHRPPGGRRYLYRYRPIVSLFPPVKIDLAKLYAVRGLKVKTPAVKKKGSTGRRPVPAGGPPGEGKEKGKKLEVRGEGQRLGVASPHQNGEETRSEALRGTAGAAVVPETYGVLTQVTSGNKHTFKGQWIDGGRGSAFVSNPGAATYLDIQPGNRNEDRELFGAGTLRAFSTSGDGMKIFAVASELHGPQGIWEYDLRSHRVRELVAGFEGRMKAAKVFEPLKGSFKMKNGATMTYYMIPPRDYDRNKKYPVMIDGPNSGRWEAHAQAFANAGIFYMAVNRRGLSSSDDLSSAAADVMEVYHHIRNKPNYDMERVYLVGFSASTSMVSELVEAHPELWRGVIFNNPSRLPQLPEKVEKYPRVLISMGDHEERASKYVERWLIEAEGKGIPVILKYHEGAGHVFRNTRLIRERLSLVARFVQR